MRNEVMPERYSLLCDESGNAGANYLDLEQPFHVAAGLLVPEPSIEPVRAIVRGAIGRTQAAELKGSRMLKSPAGRQQALTVLRAVAQVPGVVVSGLPDKVLRVFAEAYAQVAHPNHPQVTPE